MLCKCCKCMKVKTLSWSGWLVCILTWKDQITLYYLWMLLYIILGLFAWQIICKVGIHCCNCHVVVSRRAILCVNTASSRDRCSVSASSMALYSGDLYSIVHHYQNVFLNANEIQTQYCPSSIYVSLALQVPGALWFKHPLYKFPRKSGLTEMCQSDWYGPMLLNLA